MSAISIWPQSTWNRQRVLLTVFSTFLLVIGASFFYASLGPNQLFRGISIGSTIWVRHSVERHPEMVNKGDPKYGTPLIHAIWSEETEIALFLIANGADVNMQHHGVSPLMAAKMKNNDTIVDAIEEIHTTSGD